MPLFFIYFSMTSLVYHSKQVFTSHIFWKASKTSVSVLRKGRVTQLYRIIHSSTSWFIPHSMDGHNAVKLDGSPSNTSECSYDSAVPCPQQNLRAVHFCEATDWHHYLGKPELVPSWTGSATASLFAVLYKLLRLPPCNTPICISVQPLLFCLSLSD